MPAREPDDGGVATAVFLRFALLVWVQPKRCELLAPFCRRIAQPLDIDAARQAALDGSADQLGARKASEIVMLT